MKNLAQELKRKRDAEARARAVDPAKNVIYSGDGSTGAGGGGYVVPADLLNEMAHDALDHTGLTGVMDETAHDLLDHTGLTGCGGDPSPLTTKGDIYTYAADNARLEVGTDGQVLTADAASTEGIKWADAAGSIVDGVGIEDVIHKKPAFQHNYNYLPINKLTNAAAAIVELPAGAAELAFPTVLKVKNLIASPINNYYMWCSSHDNDNDADGIYLYTAPAPGGPWTFNSVVLTRGTVGADGHIAAPHIIWIPEEAKFYMYFHISDTGITGQNTSLATSADGETWTAYDSFSPVLAVGSEGTWDALAASYFRVLRIGNEWWGFYQGENAASKEQIGLAYSLDGKVWEKYANNPLTLDPDTPDTAIYLPTPLMVGHTCYLFYASNATISVAYTTDGVDLVKDNLNPVIPLGAAAAWDEGLTTYPYPLIDGDTLYMFYVGNATTASAGRNIGVTSTALEVDY